MILLTTLPFRFSEIQLLLAQLQYLTTISIDQVKILHPSVEFNLILISAACKILFSNRLKIRNQKQVNSLPRKRIGAGGGGGGREVQRGGGGERMLTWSQISADNMCLIKIRQVYSSIRTLEHENSINWCHFRDPYFYTEMVFKSVAIIRGELVNKM